MTMGWAEMRSRFHADLKPLTYFWRIMGLLFTRSDGTNKIAAGSGRPITLTNGFMTDAITENEDENKNNKMITNLSAIQLIYSCVLSILLHMYLDLYGMEVDQSISHYRMWFRFVAPINFISLLIINTYINDIIRHFDNVSYWVFLKTNADNKDPQKTSKRKPLVIIFLYVYTIYWVVSPFKRMTLIYLSGIKTDVYRDVIHPIILARIFYPYKFIILLFIYFSWQLYKELEDVYELLKNFKNEGTLMKYFTKTPASLLLEKIRLTHRKHFCICQKMNRTFGFILLQLYLNLFVEVFNGIFETIYTRNSYVKYDSISTLTAYMVGIYCTSYYGEKIINLESCLETELLTIKLNNFSQDFLQQIELYISQVRTCPIKLTAMHFVNIDKYWVSFLTTIVKISVLIIQFPSTLRSLHRKYENEY